MIYDRFDATHVDPGAHAEPRLNFPPTKVHVLGSEEQKTHTNIIRIEQGNPVG